jgi:hypothetical protein
VVCQPADRCCPETDSMNRPLFISVKEANDWLYKTVRVPFEGPVNRPIFRPTRRRVDWVREEVESCLGRERREKRTVLFPVRIDDAIMDADQAWAASIRRQRHIGDFRKWLDHNAYQTAFKRLTHDLAHEQNKIRDLLRSSTNTQKLQ